MKTVKRAKQAVAAVRNKAKTYLSQRPHRSFRRTPRQQYKTLPPIRHLLKEVLQTLKAEKKALFVFAALYAVLTYLVIGGWQQDDFVGLKDATLQVLQGDFGAIGTVTTLFAGTIAGLSAAFGSETQQILAGLVAFIFWLALVWFLRMRLSGNTVSIRDAFYNCGSPVVPSFILLLIVAVQALPATLGLYVLSTAQAEQFLQGGVEAMLFTVGAGLLCLLSGYWLCASLLALVIITLPQTYPWRALSIASTLVVGQRWQLALRLGVLAMLIMVVWALVLFPLLLLDNWLKFDWLPLIPLATQALSAFTLVVFSVYIYRLYRSLL